MSSPSPSLGSMPSPRTTTVPRRAMRRLAAALLLACTPPLVAAPAHAAPRHAGINVVDLRGAEPQHHLGNGFVIEHEGRHFGVTAKHVLLMARGTTLASTDLRHVLERWTLQHLHGDQDALELGRPLNGAADEPLDIGVLQRDALVFALAAPHPGFAVLRLAVAPARPGDRVRAVGCSYARAATCREDEYAGTVLGQSGANLLVDLGEQPLDQLFGLSGAPVLNARDEVVGIVSNVMPDAQGTPRFAPVNTDYLREVLRAQAPAPTASRSKSVRAASSR
jgi:hypothetical protein